MSTLQEEISRRRTFAIISHPDAGKTTLTEKFLLYGGAIAQAGVVKGKKNSRAATSDWMEIEKQRGISVTSSVMQFQHSGFCINILDTPGHQDFSEDTYRVLVAADSAVMLIDAAKGVEAQTIKLFKQNKEINEICRIIDKSDNIYAYGTGHGQRLMLQEFARCFLNVNKNIILIPSLTELKIIKKFMKKTDLLFIASWSGNIDKYRDTLINLEVLGIPMISIT